MKFFLAAGALTLLALPAAAQQSRTVQWGDYGNAKYSYTLCYPMHLVTPQPEADNGDGRTFRGANGNEIRVWGATNAEDWSVARAMNWRIAQFRKDGGRVTYKRAGAGSFVFSGMRGGKIVYHKGVLENDLWRSVELAYRTADRRVWDKVTTRVAGCLNAM